MQAMNFGLGFRDSAAGSVTSSHLTAERALKSKSLSQTSYPSVLSLIRGKLEPPVPTALPLVRQSARDNDTMSRSPTEEPENAFMGPSDAQG